MKNCCRRRRCRCQIKVAPKEGPLNAQTLSNICRKKSPLAQCH